MVDTSSPESVTSGDVQALADYVKFRLFSTVINVTQEATLYDPLLLQFIGRLTTLQFIPGAIDYWMRQVQSEATSGTAESVTYPDRAANLWKLFQNLAEGVQSEWNGMAARYGFQILGAPGNRPKVSYGDNGRGILMTPDAYTNPLLRSGLARVPLPGDPTGADFPWIGWDQYGPGLVLDA